MRGRQQNKVGLPCGMLLSNRFLIWYDRILNGIKMARQNKRFSCVQNVFMHRDKRDKKPSFFSLCTLVSVHVIYYFLLSLPVTQFAEYCQITANISYFAIFFFCVCVCVFKKQKNNKVEACESV